MRETIGKATREHFKDPAVRAKHSNGIKRAFAEGRKVSVLGTSRRYDEEFVKALAKSLQFRPNKPENQVLSLLEECDPGCWTYNIGKLVINGLVPDFINLHGRKAVVECFGDYWHGHIGQKKLAWHQTELGRIMSYNAAGVRCLVIWEHELKERQGVLAKLGRFLRADH